jgi:hypothetical protein
MNSHDRAPMMEVARSSVKRGAALIRDFNRYFMSSSWGSLNCNCSTCCARSGNCCWEPCCGIDLTFTEWYRCVYYDASCATPVQDPMLVNYVRRPPIDPENNQPINKFRLYPAPGGSAPIRQRGCETHGGGAGSSLNGMYWRTAKPYDFRLWDQYSPAACPPPSTETLLYLYVYYHYVNPTSGFRWQWYLNAGEEARLTSASAQVYQDRGIAYRCCGADWIVNDFATGTCQDAGGPGPWYKDIREVSIRPISVSCCKDTNDTSISGCGLNSEGDDPGVCPCRLGGWADDTTSYEPNCCASCEPDDCVDLPL